MLLTVLLAAIQMLAAPLGPAASATEPVPHAGGVGQGVKCPHATVRQADDGRTLRPRRFNELPPGRLELAVLREVDGCPIPAVLQENIGGGPAPARR